MRLAALAAVVLSGPALAFAQPFTFVSTPANDALVLIDLSSNTVVASVPVGGLPTGSAVGRAGRRVYVALRESNALAIMNTVTGAVRMVPVGAGPTGVAVGARTAYVANNAAGTVSVVDVGAGTVVATIPVGDSPLALVAARQRLYVANWGSGTVSAIDTATNSVVATIAVGAFPAGLALNTATGRLYVANFLADTVSVIDTQTLSVVSTIPVVSRPRGLAVDAAGQRLFVAGFDDGRVQVIDTGTGTVTLEAPSGGLNPLDLMLGPLGTRLYVAHLQETQGVAVLDAGTLAPVASVDVPAGAVAFSGLARHRPRAPRRNGGQSAGRALSASVRAAAAIIARGRPGSLPSLSGEVVISDEDFDIADWAVSGGGEHEATQAPTGGNPGAWRRMVHFGLATTVHRLIRPGRQYNPSSQGAIGRMDVSWDRRILAETLVSERFLVEQDSVVYRTTERTFFAPAWETDERLNLLAEDFDDGTGGHPDFSDSGTALRFGYIRRTAFNQTVPHGIDNFVVTVHHDPPGGPGELAFQKTLDSALETDAPFIYVHRRVGTQGAISVDVLTERPDGSTVQDSLNWPDGDNTDRSILVLSLGLPPGSGARTARLTLVNPTGGASIHPARGRMVITVFPEEWPPVLQALLLRLQALLGAFSPAWLLVLAAPATALAVRHSRSRQRASSLP